MPNGKLSGNHCTLRLIKCKIKAAFGIKKFCGLQFLTVPDSGKAFHATSHFHSSVRPDPVNLLGFDTEGFSVQEDVILSLPNVHDVIVNVGGKNEKGLLFASDIEAFTLSDGEKVGPLVFPDLDPHIRT